MNKYPHPGMASGASPVVCTSMANPWGWLIVNNLFAHFPAQGGLPSLGRDKNDNPILPKSFWIILRALPVRGGFNKDEMLKIYEGNPMRERIPPVDEMPRDGFVGLAFVLRGHRTVQEGRRKPPQWVGAVMNPVVWAAPAKRLAHADTSLDVGTYWEPTSEVLDWAREIIKDGIASSWERKKPNESWGLSMAPALGKKSNPDEVVFLLDDSKTKCAMCGKVLFATVRVPKKGGIDPLWLCPLHARERIKKEYGEIKAVYKHAGGEKTHE